MTKTKKQMQASEFNQTNGHANRFTFPAAPPNGHDGAATPRPATTGGRDKNTGRFLSGNPGGPGRPRRTVEREYLTALCDVITLDVWRQICQAAAKQAAAGDDKAREWLTRYVIGPSPLTPTE